jgi:hypothetical protein
MSGNSAGLGGGGIYIDNGKLTVSNCTLSGNSTQRGGGGIYSNAGTLTVSNCTLWGNSALGSGTAGYGGGALYLENTTTTVSNCTVANNAAGDGIVPSHSTVTLNNTIVANNTGGDISIPFFSSASLAGSHNLIGDGSGGLSDSLTGDPKLGLLTDNGGPTPTLALLRGSPAIDAGDATLLPAGVTTDQRGFNRVVGSKVDIGAYEVQTTDSSVALTAAPSPSVYGHAVTLTATVTLTLSGTRVTAGTVTFLDGGTVLAGGVPVNASGQATLSTAALTAGSHTIVAAYSGATGFLRAAGAASQVVNKADLYVTAAANSKTYGQTATDTGSVSGVVSGDGITASFSSPGDPATAPVGTGSYTITAALSDPNNKLGNYTVHETDATLTVNPAMLHVAANAQSKVYGDADPPLNYTVATADLRNGDTTSVLSGGLTRDAGETVAGGPYAITLGTLSSGNNYTIAFTGNALTITPAALTVTAKDAARSYGAADPTFGYDITGFVNGDSSGAVSGTPTLTTTATAGSAPGKYPIAVDVSPLSAANYTFRPVSGTLTVNAAPLSASAVNFSATAGAPFSGAVATFSNADPFGGAASYSAQITWGDGSTSAGTITGTGSTLTVSGSHTYADPVNEAVSVQVSHQLGYTSTATVTDTATVTGLGQGVGAGLTGGIGFWNNKNGQALLKSFNGGPNSAALSAWLAASFPNLYGAGANNLTGYSNAQVAAYFQTLFSLGGTQVQAEVLAVALNVYATTSSLGGSAGAAYGFTVSATGLGARSYSVGRDGAAFGVADNATLDVYQLLLAVNTRAVNGVLYGGKATPQAECADLLSALNYAGTI